MRAISTCYVLRAKTLNGTFNLIFAAEDFDLALGIDDDDTPGAIRSVFDNATSPTDDNMKSLNSGVSDGIDDNSDDQGPVEKEFDETY